MAALDGKAFYLNDVSIHMMKDWFLSSHEYLEAGAFSTRLSNLHCPREYPVVNHQSTILLIGPGNDGPVKVVFDFESPSKMLFSANVEFIEAKANVKQLGLLTQLMQMITKKDPNS